MATASAIATPGLGSRIVYPGDYNGLATDPKGEVVSFWGALAKVQLDEPIFDPEKGETHSHVFMNCQWIEVL